MIAKNYDQLTNGRYISHHPYFYNAIQTKNDILIAMEKNQIRNYHLVNIKTKGSRQVTFEKQINDFSATFINEDEFIVDDSENKIYKFNIRLNQKSILLDIKDDKWIISGPPSPNKEGTKIILCLHEKASAVITNISNTWDNFLQQSKDGLRSRLVLFDINKKSLTILLDTKDYVPKNQWLNHPQFSPLSDDIITYCHEGLGGTVKDRIWIYDLKKNIKRSICPQEQENQIISHEFFYKSQQKIGYVKIDNDKSKTGFLCEYDIEADMNRTICELPRCSHFITDFCDEYVIADEAYPDSKIMSGENENDDNNKLGLYLVRIDDGKIKKIGYHNSQMKSYGNSQDAHAHPIFTQDNEKVIFTSDMSGIPQVYIINLEKEKCE